MNAAARIDAFSDWGDTARNGLPLRGAESYLGPQIHCATWQRQVGINGKRVAVIGTGAAVARVLPAVAAKARKVTVFQHDPAWVLPYPPLPDLDRVPGPLGGLLRLTRDVAGLLRLPDPGPALTEPPAADAGALRRLPFALTSRAAALNLRLQVRDSWTRRLLTPESPTAITCHNRYYRALHRPNCRLVTWPIARLAPHGIRTVDGVEHRVDCIIYAEENL
ncbi:hypothetical protein HLB23_10700 [Nocardia uniformis]|uniref:Uncharacterized protein n=1 Tax=Nocardia uniformis TaxID=53432 RepID=A0A849BYJ1_9NOCA|nr:hypothetical protein [Nocardia uniformis]NNH70328.1 hypothetical protein [Nocardia uniformis]